MKNLFKALALVTLLAAFAGSSFAQTALTQTTLSSTQTVGSSGSASGLGTTSYQTTVSVAAATGITTAFNGQPVSIIYVDQEAEGILTLVQGQTLVYNVIRGFMGTKASAHITGSMVLIGTVSPQFGGYSGSGGLQATDPPNNGNCTSTNTGLTPWVNMITAEQWLCSTITNTWVPGWNNRLVPASTKVTTAVASVAGTTTPSGPLFHITGTNAITAWGIPVGFNATAAGGGQFCVIPDAAFTTTATNNIATAVTAVANLEMCWTWDATNSKFVVVQSK